MSGQESLCRQPKKGNFRARLTLEPGSLPHPIPLGLDEGSGPGFRVTLRTRAIARVLRAGSGYKPEIS